MPTRYLFIAALMMLVAPGLQATEPISENLQWLREEDWALFKKMVDSGEYSRDPENYFECAGFGAIGFRSAPFDFPLYFFDPASRRLISVCGGLSCLLASDVSRSDFRAQLSEDRVRMLEAQDGMCRTMCPPPEWRAQGCYEKFHAARERFRSSNRPLQSPR